MGRNCALLLVVLLFGCGGEDNPAELGREGACNTLGLKIVGGEGCRAAGSPIAAILVDRGGGVFQLCSGTLITGNQLLTAAHCFEPPIREAAAAVGFDVYQISTWITHPAFAGEGAIAPSDLAVVTLNRSVNVSPVSIVGSRSIQPGELITVFGYGTDEKGRTALDEKREETLKAGNMLVSDSLAGVFLAEFNATRSAVCSGDSGGPAVQIVNGVAGVVGVTSFDIAGCGRNSKSGFVAVSSNLDFLRTAAPQAQFR